MAKLREPWQKGQRLLQIHACLAHRQQKDAAADGSLTMPGQAVVRAVRGSCHVRGVSSHSSHHPGALNKADAAWGLTALFENKRRRGTMGLLSFGTLSQLPARSDISPASSTNDGTGDERRQATVHAKARRTERCPRHHRIPHSNRGAAGGRKREEGKWTDDGQRLSRWQVALVGRVGRRLDVWIYPTLGDEVVAKHAVHDNVPSRTCLFYETCTYATSSPPPGPLQQ